MRKRFDDILNECVCRLEASDSDIESVLSRYPEHTDELRPYLEVWTALSAVEKAQGSPVGAMRGRQQLLTAIARAEQPERGSSFNNSPALKGRLSMRFVGMKFAGMFVAGAVLALGITFLTGNLGFGNGSPAVAGVPPACLAALDFNHDGSLTVEDVNQLGEVVNNDGQLNDAQLQEFDVNHDGHVDVNDVVQIVDEVVSCFQGQQPAP